VRCSRDQAQSGANGGGERLLARFVLRSAARRLAAALDSINAFATSRPVCSA